MMLALETALRTAKQKIVLMMEVRVLKLMIVKTTAMKIRAKKMMIRTVELLAAMSMEQVMKQTMVTARRIAKVTVVQMIVMVTVVKVIVLVLAMN